MEAIVTNDFSRWLLTSIPMVVTSSAGATLLPYLATLSTKVTIMILVTSFLSWSVGLCLINLILVCYFWRLISHKLPSGPLLASGFLPVAPLGEPSLAFSNKNADSLQRNSLGVSRQYHLPYRRTSRLRHPENGHLPLKLPQSHPLRTNPILASAPVPKHIERHRRCHPLARHPPLPLSPRPRHLLACSSHRHYHLPLSSKIQCKPSFPTHTTQNRP